MLYSVFKQIRQLVTISHSYDQKTKIVEEHVIFSREDANNMIISKNRHYSNFQAFDSNGDRLSIMNMQLVMALYEKSISKQEEIIHKLKKEENEVEFKELQDKISFMKDHLIQIQEKKKIEIWIPLPEHRKLKKNETRSFILKYDAPNHKTKEHSLSFEKHNVELVRYVLEEPLNFEFKMKPTLFENDKCKGTLEEKKFPGISVQRTFKSTSIRIKPMDLERLSGKQYHIKYSFKPKSEVTSLPKIGFLLLLISSAGLFFMQLPIIEPYVSSMFPIISKYHVQIVIGINSTALILTGLIKQEVIRDDYKYIFVGIIAFSISSLFFPFLLLSLLENF